MFQSKASSGGIQSMTKTARLALSPSEGLMVYDTDQHILFMYNGTMWRPALLPDPRSMYYFYDDFDGAQTTFANWRGSASGAGTGIATITNASNYPGIMQFDVGVSGLGLVVLYRADATMMNPGGGDMFCQYGLTLPTLSTVDEEYLIYAGLGDTVSASGNHTDGVYFKYDRLTDGNFWSANTAKGGVRTKTVTAAAVTTSQVRLGVNVVGTNAYFYVNGTLVATHTTNLPVAGDYTTPSMKIEKTAGLTSRYANWDFCEAWQIFGTRR